jgi:eukaryotic-like serine/threonine-protein kinase
MGAVFLAEHSLIGRRAAIKVLLPALSQQRDIVDRFFNEARATTSIPDPGIVQVFDFGFHTDNSAYIAMEFLEGEPLDIRLRRLGRLSASEALRITRQAAGSLAAAHSRGIVHRDLKPDNLFMVRDPEAFNGERPKILDFGIAKLNGDEPGRMRTRTGALMGTPVYMSPEQCRGSGQLDHRSDIYSLGCVLFHLITGRPPFDMEGMGEIISAHLREPAPVPSMLVQGMPPGVDELVAGCLAKSPDQRFQTMSDLQTACDALLARITQSGPSAPTIALATPLAPGFRSVSPGTPSTPVPGTIPPIRSGSPTTLSTATGQQPAAALTRRRTGVWVGIGLGLVAGVAAIGVIASSGKTTPKPDVVVTPPPPVVAAPAPPPVAAPPDAALVVAAPPPDATPVAVVPPDAAPAPKPKTKTTTKPKEDLYDDR